MTKEKAINTIISGGCDTNQISDGYHTFGELYEHRITLFIALALAIKVSDSHNLSNQVWRSKKHSDGTELQGWFILGIGQDKGEQITYHLPIKKWVDTDFAETLDYAPQWDGHTSDDVLKRISTL